MLPRAKKVALIGHVADELQTVHPRTANCWAGNLEAKGVAPIRRIDGRAVHVLARVFKERTSSATSLSIPDVYACPCASYIRVN